MGKTIKIKTEDLELTPAQATFLCGPVIRPDSYFGGEKQMIDKLVKKNLVKRAMVPTSVGGSYKAQVVVTGLALIAVSCHIADGKPLNVLSESSSWTDA